MWPLAAGWAFKFIHHLSSICNVSRFSGETWLEETGRNVSLKR